MGARLWALGFRAAAVLAPALDVMAAEARTLLLGLEAGQERSARRQGTVRGAEGRAPFSQDTGVSDSNISHPRGG